MSNIIIYTTEDGATRIDLRLENGTVWLSQLEIAELFQTSKQNISKHIQAIFDDQELDEKATVNQQLTVQKEGGREVSRSLTLYNLDVILAVGYRVRSVRGVQFRKWATGIIREFTIKAYAMAERNIPMTMQDWEVRLNRFLEATDREVLQDAGKVSKEVADAHALSEFEKYRVVQDRLYESDFDKALKAQLTHNTQGQRDE